MKLKRKIIRKEKLVNKIVNEDCLVTMNRLIKKGQKVDLILTSPPYNTSRNVKSTKHLMDNNIIRYNSYEDGCMSDDEYIEWTLNVFNNFDKVLKHKGVILYNMSYASDSQQMKGRNPNILMWLCISDIIRRSNFTVADTIVWKKSNALPNNTSPNKLTRIVEYIFVIVRKDELSTFNMNKQVKSKSVTGQKYYENAFNFIEAKNNDGSNPYNKATFSTDLCNQLLGLYAKKNDLVYDPFIGIGTTAIASKMNGMDYLGSELSKVQCKYAQSRLEDL